MPVGMKVGLHGLMLHMGSGLSKIGVSPCRFLLRCDVDVVLCRSRWVEICRNMKFP